MKQHLAYIVGPAIAVGIVWFSHGEVAELHAASCTIGSGIAIKGDAQITCVQTAPGPGVPPKSAVFSTNADQLATLAAQTTGRLTAQEFLLAPGGAKVHDHCETDGLIALDGSGAMLFCQRKTWASLDSARSDAASN